MLPSWPKTADFGVVSPGMGYKDKAISVWQIPVAIISTTISLGPGAGNVTGSSFQLVSFFPSEVVVKGWETIARADWTVMMMMIFCDAVLMNCDKAYPAHVQAGIRWLK